MSRFTFIASDNPLLEIDQSGFIRLKVKDMKKMVPVPNGPIPWDEMDDEAEVLYAENESALGGLQVSLCTNPPDGLELYIKKKFAYWLGGNFQTKCVSQLMDYIQINISTEDKVELWSIWFGDGFQEIKPIKISLQKISVGDLVLLKDSDCCLCVE